MEIHSLNRLSFWACWRPAEAQFAWDSPAGHVAKWEGASWSPLSTRVAGSGSPNVTALAELDDSNGPALYAGGSFTTAGGIPSSYIAKMGAATSLLNGFPLP